MVLSQDPGEAIVLSQLQSVLYYKRYINNESAPVKVKSNT